MKAASEEVVIKDGILDTRSRSENGSEFRVAPLAVRGELEFLQCCTQVVESHRSGIQQDDVHTSQYGE
ncbi:hypothetical protein GCM10010234_65720 [Streptomyces hawaiiensis]